MLHYRERRWGYRVIPVNFFLNHKIMSLILLIEQIWQSSDPDTEAKSCGGGLSDSDKATLLKVAAHLDAYVVARGIVDYGKFPEPKVSETTAVPENFGDLLLLLMFAMHHSDSLVFHTPELRERQLNSWAQRANQPPTRVRAASSLGPTRLSSMLEQT
jgi:hypothetical protein